MQDEKVEQYKLWPTNLDRKKFSEIVKNSALALNRYFHEMGSWDEGQIADRGEALFSHALSKWPYPHPTRT